MSEPQLETDLLSDPRARIYACGRQDIAAGRIDRRVLAALYLLIVSGVDPTVSALECGHGGEAQAASTREHADGDAVTISALNGTRVGAGSLVEVAVRRLLTMPGAMAPRQIIGPVRIPSSPGTSVRRGAPDRLDIGFGPSRQAHGGPTASPPSQTQTQSHSPKPDPPPRQRARPRRPARRMSPQPAPPAEHGRVAKVDRAPVRPRRVARTEDTNELGGSRHTGFSRAGRANTLGVAAAASRRRARHRAGAKAPRERPATPRRRSKRRTRFGRRFLKPSGESLDLGSGGGARNPRHRERSSPNTARS